MFLTLSGKGRGPPACGLGSLGAFPPPILPMSWEGATISPSLWVSCSCPAKLPVIPLSGGSKGQVSAPKFKAGPGTATSVHLPRLSLSLASLALLLPHEQAALELPFFLWPQGARTPSQLRGRGFPFLWAPPHTPPHFTPPPPDSKDALGLFQRLHHTSPQSAIPADPTGFLVPDPHPGLPVALVPLAACLTRGQSLSGSWPCRGFCLSGRFSHAGEEVQGFQQPDCGQKFPNADSKHHAYFAGD